ncbi:hypothetical protein DEU56DRAFT_913356 [Suillus clintonianus]|uniref:uncharacterized protein n=1 Tax=Suillus clintonianus TaxID=1904413 RepID=UPI001B87FA16|nr:uncharacterized protein DEU56DRAFT_913356 [Suillus clintonianus]KAG2135240.1 hypothetical protein DEU56DRAFT_913356 [Suillus clintonianus]
MAPPRWTTPEELEWLQNELPEFLKMQKDQRLTRFYELLYPRWFSQFPECLRYWGPTGKPPRENVRQDDDSGDEISPLALTPEQEAELEEANEIRRKKLREWFRNNGKSKTTPGTTSTGKALARLLGQRARGVHDLKEIEVYSKSHYKTKIQPLVEDNVNENHLDPKKRIAVVQKYTNRCFAAEPEYVKAEIREETTRINTARRLASVVSQTRTKEEIYHAIQELPLVLGQICEDLAVLTGGWHYTLVMGGPDPMCEGDIMTLSFHHGKGRDGLSFKASNPDFHEQYLAPFEKHLRSVFGHQVSESSESSSSANPSPPATSDLALPNAQNDSGPKVPGTHVFPHDSVMDPNVPVSDADIDAFISSLRPLTADGLNGQWWPNQGQDMQMAAPPLINPPLTITESLIDSPMRAAPPFTSPPPLTIAESFIDSPMRAAPPFTPPFTSPPPAISESLIEPPVQGLDSSIGVFAPPRILDSSIGVVTLNPVPSSPSRSATTPAATDSYSFPPVSSAPALLTDTTSKSIPTAPDTLLPAASVPPVSSAPPTAPDTLLPAACVPPVSSAPGRRSARMTRPSTRVQDANKIGDDAKAVTSKRKRKGTAEATTGKKYVFHQFSVLFHPAKH